MSTAATCEVSDGFAAAVLAAGSAGELLGVEVNFGSFEHPEWGAALYVRRAEDRRFHWVRRDGQELRVHDHQFRQAFRDWLEVNPYPYGRFTAPEVAS